MKAGDIIFVRNRSILSKLIRFFDGKGKWSHVCIALSNTHILEAEYIVNTRIKKIDYDDYEIVDIGLNADEIEKIIHYGIDLTSIKYGYTTIAWYFFGYFFGWHGRNMWNSTYNMICTDVIDYLLWKIGRMTEEQYINGYTPNELYALLRTK